MLIFSDQPLEWRLIAGYRIGNDLSEARCTAGFRLGLCPLWVIRDRGGCKGGIAHVRFAPKADNHADASLGSLSAINGLVHCSKQRAWVALFDHFVGDGEDTRRNGKAERFGSLEIDDQLEFSRLLHRKIDWFHAA